MLLLSALLLLNCRTLSPISKENGSLTAEVRAISTASSIPTLMPLAVTVTQTSLPSTGLKNLAAGIALELGDLPPGFYALPKDLSGSELEIQSQFSFKTDQKYYEILSGFTTIYPYSQRDSSDGIERIRSQMDILAGSIAKGYTTDIKDATIMPLKMESQVGDAYSGRVILEPLTDPDLQEYSSRTEILVFERNKITVILLVQYIEGFDIPITILEAAQMLDRKISDLKIQ